MDDLNDGEDGPPEGAGRDPLSDAPSQEAPEQRTVPSESPLSRMETDAIPKSAGREPDRDTQIAERLRRVTQMKRAAMEVIEIGRASCRERV